MQTHPYEYCEVDLIKPEFCELIYEELKPGFYNEYKPEIQSVTVLFQMLTGCMNDSCR